MFCSVAAALMPQLPNNHSTDGWSKKRRVNNQYKPGVGLCHVMGGDSPILISICTASPSMAPVFVCLLSLHQAEIGGGETEVGVEGSAFQSTLDHYIGV